ncbi:MAG TPA: EthD domain-containing protein [Microthrixaceae bacterium]|jgi:uncharacterized protein (TIGR02118 family)|nr:EthD domain-containing protein [Microthrixaceae bacterium]
MVKLFALIRRREGMTFDDFVDHWRNSHGPLIRDTPELARHIVRYEQHPRHRGDALSGSEGVDGVAVQWFNSIDDFVGFISEPAYAELIAPDERRFIDTASIEFVITDAPNVVIDGPRSPIEGAVESSATATEGGAR